MANNSMAVCFRPYEHILPQERGLPASFLLLLLRHRMDRWDIRPVECCRRSERGVSLYSWTLSVAAATGAQIGYGTRWPSSGNANDADAQRCYAWTWAGGLVHQGQPQLAERSTRGQ